MSSDSLMKRNSWIVVAAGTLFDIAFCFVVEDESKDARLYAGTMIGILTVIPLYSRTDTRQLHSVVEKALQKRKSIRE